MTRISLRLIIILITLSGCQSKVNTNQVFINENISEIISEDIIKLDNRIISSFKTNNPSNIMDILSPKLLENGGEHLDSLFYTMNQYFKYADFKQLDRYYIINSQKDVSNTIFSGMSELDDYIIHYKAIDKNVYISLYTANDSPNEILITLIYGNTPSGWKLHHLQLGTYSIYGKTAIDYYLEAKRLDSLGYIVDAANTLYLSQQNLKPANELWQWVNEKDITDLHEKVLDKINKAYTFPFVINEIETKPEIYTIFPQMTPDSWETMIQYYSQIDLKDTVRLKQENMAIQKLIGDKFKGIDIDKDYLLYRASDRLPNGSPLPMNYYGFVQKFGNNP